MNDFFNYLDSMQGTILAVLIIIAYTAVMILIGAYIGYRVFKTDFLSYTDHDYPRN